MDEDAWNVWMLARVDRTGVCMVSSECSGLGGSQ